MTRQKTFNRVKIIGGGLAGSEAALQLAEKGFDIDFYEMRGPHKTPAHLTDQFAELVCSNSFGNETEGTAPHQLKWEAQKLNSFLLKIAKECQVPAGQALAVDRSLFSQKVTERIKNHPRISVYQTKIENLSQLQSQIKLQTEIEVTSQVEIPSQLEVPTQISASQDSKHIPILVATGPLTDEKLAQDLQNHFGEKLLSFFDAIAPIIDADTINYDIVWAADRYDKGEPDYLNCPLNKEQYDRLIHEIENSEKITPKDFDQIPFFEGCMPIEEIVRRGPDTLRFGPLKPVGLINPLTGERPYAVVQLRQENKEKTAYNLVGFQTRMTYSEQKRIFNMIPGLEKAEFLKLGSIHRNLFITTPLCLNPNLSSKKNSDLFFTGQMIGVEGYFESICMGLMSALFIENHLQLRRKEADWNAVMTAEAGTKKAMTEQVMMEPGPHHQQDYNSPPRGSALGSLLNAILDTTNVKHFQPTNINFGLFPQPLSKEKIRDKKKKKELQIQTARLEFNQWLEKKTESQI